MGRGLYHHLKEKSLSALRVVSEGLTSRDATSLLIDPTCFVAKTRYPGFSSI